MNRYLRATLFGVLAFVVQVCSALDVHLSQLTAKSEALALSALSSTPASAQMLGLLLWYLALGLLTHIAPLLAATKIHADLERRAAAPVAAYLQRRGMVELVLATMLVAMIMLNWLFFRASQALPNSHLFFVQSASPILIYGVLGLSIAATGYWLIVAASWRARTGACALLVALVAPVGWSSGLQSPPARKSAPDIIVIGVDSLRQDHLRTYGYPDTGLTPNIDAFLGRSVRFDQAFTPQARTFVAYMSLLTGQYPVRNGVRENLYPLDLFDQRASVAHDFRSAGYQTVLAMDEARFANFSERYGFDAVVSPPPGAADFLFGSFVDTVGTNLLQLVPRAEAIMPHVSANRAAVNIYRPETHSERLASTLARADGEKPLFLVSHFCMAHSPFLKKAPPEPTLPSPYTDSNPRYRAALRIADRQVGDLLQRLEQSGRLENAIVVLMSDHGEALGMEKDVWTMLVNAQVPMLRSYYGHGMPALDESQTRVVLGLQRFRAGRPVWNARQDAQPRSLVDVAPTLLQLSRVEHANKRFDGNGLLNPDGVPTQQKNRPVYLESGISGGSLQQANVDPGAVADEFSHLYAITPDLRFELIPHYLPNALRMKQRAVVLGRYGVSSWPGSEGGTLGCWLVVDRKTRVARCLPMNTSDEVVKAYRPLVCQQFRQDTEFHSTWCPTPTPQRTQAIH